MLIKIHNPFSMKKGMSIALEVSRYELTSEQINKINHLITQLDNSFNKIELSITEDLLSDIKECIAIFKHSETIRWIRDDFANEILNFTVTANN